MDGVYNELTEMRVRTPWIEALRKQKEQGVELSRKSNTPADRDLTPRKMSDSFHRVVWWTLGLHQINVPLTDPGIGDTISRRSLAE